MTKLDKRLQEALEQIEAGADPQSVMASLPTNEAAELSGLIRLAVALREMPHTEAISSALPRSVAQAARDLPASHVQPRWRQAWSQVYLIGFAALLLAIFVGVFIAPGLLDPRPADEATATPISDATFTPQPTPLPGLTQGHFTVIGSEPVIMHDLGGVWNSTRLDPGAVVAHDGSATMFTNGGTTVQGPFNIGLLTSTDGLTWMERATVSMLRAADVPYKPKEVYVSSALVEPDGTWVMFFGTYDDFDKFGFKSRIGRATAQSPDGPWTADPQPALVPDSKGGWDESGVWAASVVRTDSGYLMLYSGADARGNSQIGMATSPDGITWQKYDDPATTGAPYALSDPVLRPDPNSDWDAVSIEQPRLVSTPQGLVMLYSSHSSGIAISVNIGAAISQDGISWTRHPLNPIFRQRDVPSSHRLGGMALLYRHDTYWLYFESVDLDGVFSDIWLAAHREGLFDE
jgi:predicted GH43/DUF377 family glycosyl hydrolase